MVSALGTPGLLPLAHTKTKAGGYPARRQVTLSQLASNAVGIESKKKTSLPSSRDHLR